MDTFRPLKLTTGARCYEASATLSPGECRQVEIVVLFAGSDRDPQGAVDSTVRRYVQRSCSVRMLASIIQAMQQFLNVWPSLGRHCRYATPKSRIQRERDSRLISQPLGVSPDSFGAGQDINGRYVV